MADVGGHDIAEEFYQAVVRRSASPITEVAEKCNVSRQAVHKHARKLIKEGKIRTKGVGRSLKYTVAQILENFDLTKSRDEHSMWLIFEPLLIDYPKNVYQILMHGLTEIANNAIDHSSGTELQILLLLKENSIQLALIDNGIGIFKKIQQDAGLVDEKLSLLELSKGKFTSDPSKHSGEGIFFTSRMFDTFMISSRGLVFVHAVNDLLLDMTLNEAGTRVIMNLNLPCCRTTKEVFDEFASTDGDYRFNKTLVPLRLASLSGKDMLVSRSQAKRALSRVEKFETVLMDFDKVETVGQAFADEIFRVFCSKHPEITVVPLNMNEDVQAMVLRAMELKNKPEQ